MVEILLVEDNPGDVELAREALARGRPASRLDVVEDGEQALDYLFRRDPFVDAPRPDLIILDLNLPRRGGREVLAEIKSTPALRRIPVVILTTSGAPEDVVACYDAHANCYITKPSDLEEFLAAVRSIEDFWMTTVNLPPNPAR